MTENSTPATKTLFVATTIFSAGLALGSLGLRAASADTITRNPSKDVTLFQDDFGTWADGSGEFLFVGNTANQASRRTILKFDLSAIPRGAVISSATLRLTVNRTRAGSPMQTDVHRVTRDWGEGASNSSGNEGGGTASAPGDATWIHTFYDEAGTSLWTNPGGDYAREPSTSTNVPTGSSGNHTFTGAGLAADVQRWVDGTAGNFGWILIGNELGLMNARRYASRTNGSSNARPLLTVVYTVPPPPCDADVTEDGTVDGSDFIAFINSFAIGLTAVDPVADIDGDGTIDGTDFITFINAFGAGC